MAASPEPTSAKCIKFKKDVISDESKIKQLYKRYEPAAGKKGSSYSKTKFKSYYSKLVEYNEQAKLTVCPMHYAGRGNEPYLIDLGRELKSRVNLMWTGRQICSEYLDVSDAVVFERSAMRPALYWDNFPVNDNLVKKRLAQIA